MKHINQYITEYIIKKKLDNPIDSEDHYKYFPKTREELTKTLKNVLIIRYIILIVLTQVR